MSIPEFKYMEFALSPHNYDTPVIPFTPHKSLYKRLAKCTFNASVVIPIGGTLEGVVLQSDTTTSTSANAIGLFFSTAPVANSTTYSAMYGTKKTINNMPSSNSGYRYIAGSLYVVSGTDANKKIRFKGARYQPDSSTVPKNWSEIETNGLVKTVVDDATVESIRIVNIPIDLEYRSINNETLSYLPRCVDHFKIENKESTTITVDLVGDWYIEVYDTSPSTITYETDIVPYKLASYVINSLDMYIFQVGNLLYELSPNRVINIKNALKLIIERWSAMTLYKNPKYISIDDEEDWSLRNRIWKP